jgi:hypothetical protein
MKRRRVSGGGESAGGYVLRVLRVDVDRAAHQRLRPHEHRLGSAGRALSRDCSDLSRSRCLKGWSFRLKSVRDLNHRDRYLSRASMAAVA